MVFLCSKSDSIKLLIRLHLGLSHLHEHKFRPFFQNLSNPLCAYGKDIESVTHFFLHCTNFHIPRQNLFQNIRNIDKQILARSKTQITQIFLYDNRNYNFTINPFVPNAPFLYLLKNISGKNSPWKIAPQKITPPIPPMKILWSFSYL